jgi:hypothetical protein
MHPLVIQPALAGLLDPLQPPRVRFGRRPGICYEVAVSRCAPPDAFRELHGRATDDKPGCRALARIGGGCAEATLGQQVVDLKVPPQSPDHAESFRHLRIDHLHHIIVNQVQSGRRAAG